MNNLHPVISVTVPLALRRGKDSTADKSYPVREAVTIQRQLVTKGPCVKTPLWRMLGTKRPSRTHNRHKTNL